MSNIFKFHRRTNNSNVVLRTANTAISGLFAGENLQDQSSYSNVISTKLVTVNNSYYKYGTGSLSFNGIDSSITIPSFTTSGDFTIAGWFYKTKDVPYGLTYAMIFTDGPVANWFGFTTNTAIATGFGGFTVPNINNNWAHIALVRFNGVVKLYINGVAMAETYTSASNYTYSKIGCFGDNTTNSYSWGGYIDDFFYTNSAIFTSNFTPPLQLINTIPQTIQISQPDSTTVNISLTRSLLDTSYTATCSDGQTKTQSALPISFTGLTVGNEYTFTVVNNAIIDYPITSSATHVVTTVNNTKLRIIGGSNVGTSTFTDTSSNNTAITRNGDTVYSTAITKYNTTSIRFDGTGDYLSYSPITFNADFTFETWAYRSSAVSSYMMLFANNTTSDWVGFTGGDTTISVFATNITVPSLLNQWVHYAIVRIGSTVTLYVNGVSRGTMTYSNTVTNDRIGAFGNLYAWNGYMDAVKLSSSALYTTNFTPSQL
jgi:hypothetical protein